MREFELDVESENIQIKDCIKCPIYCHRTIFMPCSHGKEEYKYRDGIKCKYFEGLHYKYYKRKMFIRCVFDEGVKNVKCNRPSYKEKPYYTTKTSSQ